MEDQSRRGVVYHIDAELIHRTKARSIRSNIEKLDNQIRKAQKDLQLVKITEHALGQVQMILKQMREIAVQAANASGADRIRLNIQINALKRHIDRIVANATFEGVNLLDGSMGSISSAIDAVKAALEN